MGAFGNRDSQAAQARIAVMAILYNQPLGAYFEIDQIIDLGWDLRPIDCDCLGGHAGDCAADTRSTERWRWYKRIQTALRTMGEQGWVAPFDDHTSGKKAWQITPAGVTAYQAEMALFAKEVEADLEQLDVSARD